MSSDSILDVARDFNALNRQEFLCIRRVITASNDWHISIRRIPIQLPRHVVYSLHPLSRCFGHSESIGTAMGYQLGEYVYLGGFLPSATHEFQSFTLIKRWLAPTFCSAVDLGSESAVLVITRLIMLQFISPGFQRVVEI